MKNTIKVLWYIVVSAMVLTMFVLVTAKVFAHGEGECLKGQSGTVVKIIDHLRDTDLKGFVHGHLYEYYDKHGNPTGQGKGFFIDFDDTDSDSFADCPATPRFSAHSPRQRSQRSPVNSCDPEPAPVGFTCDDLNVRDASDVCHEWDFRESSYAGIPVLPDSIETIGDLWGYFHDLTGREIDITFLISGWLWQTYKGQGLGAIPITPHMGIGVNERTIGFIDSPIGIAGKQVQGETITLEKPEGVPHRYHFVGFPQSPANYETFGDLLVYGVSHVRRRIIVDGRLDFQHIYTTTSEGADKIIQPGDAVVMLITREVTLDLSGSVAAAPSVRRKGTLATSWGAMKR